MSREVPGYRQEVELLHERFGGKAIISWKEIIEYTGKSDSWCSKHLNVPHGNCTVAKLATALASLK